jgi:hypothetical protein
MERLAPRPNHAKTGPVHSNNIRDQFLEMRAKGLSLARIATGLNASQRTIVGRNGQLAPPLASRPPPVTAPAEKI